MRYTSRSVVGFVIGILISVGSASAGEITGTVTFTEGSTTPVYTLDVAAHTALDVPPVDSQTVSNGGAYSLTVPDGTYYLSVVVDLNSSGGPPDPGEPWAWYDSDHNRAADPVAVSGSTPGIDIAFGVIYVDADATAGANDGSSWADAYTDLAVGIATASTGVDVWVAEGTYTPGTTVSSTFDLKNGVGIYGGFDGTETTREQRHPDAHLTVLDGDYGADKVYHVVSSWSHDSTALIDGFTVTGGSADGVGAPNNYGGGMLVTGGYPVVVNVNFVGNFAAQAGGGMAAYNFGRPYVYNCGFFGNTAGSYPVGTGGGFYGASAGEGLVNCVFSGNSAGLRGGGVYISSGSYGGMLRNLSVSGNTAGYEAGGFFIDNTLAPGVDLTNSIVWDNVGGGYPNVLFWGTVSASRDIVQGGLVGGTNILTGDPLFEDPNGADDVLGTVDDDLRVQSSSPAIDAAENAAVPPDVGDCDYDFVTSEPMPIDKDLNARFQDAPTVPDTGTGTPPIVDLGAYEFTVNPRIFEDGFELGNTTAWSSAVP